jgi:SAM-dependent methyltransferase
MLSEYNDRGWTSIITRLKAWLNKDYRTRKSRDAFDQVISSAPRNHLCLSIGGGPGRPSSKLTNVNIGPFPNVDVVGDAHLLPYACSTVDAIYCEAVLEHLQDPATAVQEMFRILKPGGRVIAITPFMQGFHGYPSHFQNFTLFGHSLLFSRSGFQILDSGTCVGPVYATVGAISGFLSKCLPPFVGLPIGMVWKVIGACVRPLDLLISRSETSHMMASTTYVLAQKPAAI